MPASPASVMQIIFHWSSSCRMEMIVPIWVIQSMMTSVPPSGAPIPARATMSFGKKVQ